MTTIVAQSTVDAAFASLVHGIEELDDLQAPDSETDAWRGFTVGATLVAAAWAGYAFIVT
jgi:hypothetical protein